MKVDGWRRKWLVVVCSFLFLGLISIATPARSLHRSNRPVLRHLTVQKQQPQQPSHTAVAAPMLDTETMPSPSPPTRASSTTGPARALGLTSQGCDVVLAIPTLPRAQDYLNISLSALLCQLPHPTELDGELRICVAVHNVRPAADTERHGGSRSSSFVRAREALAARPDFLFSTSPYEEPPLRSSATKLERTRRQTSDVAHMLLTLEPVAPKYLVLLEDDWLVCEGGIAALRCVHVSLMEGCGLLMGCC